MADESSFRPAPVSRSSAAHQVAEQIRNAILNGDLSQGSRLPSELQMAADFGVSRGTIRKALSTLAAERLVRVERGAAGGHFVLLPQPKQAATMLGEAMTLWLTEGDVTLADVTQARLSLERVCVRLAAHNRTPEDLAQVRGILDEARPVADDFKRLATLDLEFHLALGRASGNGLIEFFMMTVHSLGPIASRLIMNELDWAVVWNQHESIYKAVYEQDEMKAETSLEEHIGYISENLQWHLPDLVIADVDLDAPRVDKRGT